MDKGQSIKYVCMAFGILDPSPFHTQPVITVVLQDWYIL